MKPKGFGFCVQVLLAVGLILSFCQYGLLARSSHAIDTVYTFNPISYPSLPSDYHFYKQVHSPDFWHFSLFIGGYQNEGPIRYVDFAIVRYDGQRDVDSTWQMSASMSGTLMPFVALFRSGDSCYVLYTTRDSLALQELHPHCSVRSIHPPTGATLEIDSTHLTLGMDCLAWYDLRSFQYLDTTRIHRLQPLGRLVSAAEERAVFKLDTLNTSIFSLVDSRTDSVLSRTELAKFGVYNDPFMASTIRLGTTVDTIVCYNFRTSATESVPIPKEHRNLWFSSSSHTLTVLDTANTIRIYDLQNDSVLLSVHALPGSMIRTNVPEKLACMSPNGLVEYWYNSRLRTDYSFTTDQTARYTTYILDSASTAFTSSSAKDSFWFAVATMHHIIVYKRPIVVSVAAIATLSLDEKGLYRIMNSDGLCTIVNPDTSQEYTTVPRNAFWNNMSEFRILNSQNLLVDRGSSYAVRIVDGRLSPQQVLASWDFDPSTYRFTVNSGQLIQFSPSSSGAYSLSRLNLNTLTNTPIPWHTYIAQLICMSQDGRLALVRDTSGTVLVKQIDNDVVVANLGLHSSVSVACFNASASKVLLFDSGLSSLLEYSIPAAQEKVITHSAWNKYSALSYSSTERYILTDHSSIERSSGLETVVSGFRTPLALRECDDLDSLYYAAAETSYRMDLSTSFFIRDTDALTVYCASAHGLVFSIDTNTKTWRVDDRARDVHHVRSYPEALFATNTWQVGASIKDWSTPGKGTFAAQSRKGSLFVWHFEDDSINSNVSDNHPSSQPYLTVFPNPCTTSSIHLGDEYAGYEVRLFNTLGLPVLSTLNQNGTIDVQQLANGCYQLELRSGPRVVYGRVVVQR